MEATPKSRKYKDGPVEFFREWQRTTAFKFPYLKVGSVFNDYDFHLMCNVNDNVKNMDALLLDYWPC